MPVGNFRHQPKMSPRACRFISVANAFPHLTLHFRHGSSAISNAEPAAKVAEVAEIREREHSVVINFIISKPDTIYELLVVGRIPSSLQPGGVQPAKISGNLQIFAVKGVGAGNYITITPVLYAVRNHLLAGLFRWVKEATSSLRTLFISPPMRAA